MTFEDLNLNKPLLQALADLQLVTPTPIQERAFPIIMSGKDVLGIAQTGTGKTFAYLLPLLRMWKFSKERHPQILIIVPTRELVVQVVEACQQISVYQNLVTLGVHGGSNLNKQAMEILQGLDVLVGTPGRLLDLAYHGTLQLKHIKKLVIDEVDEMLDQGFRPQLTRILELATAKRQNLMFSATMTEDIEAIIEDYFDFPEVVEAAPTGTPLENIEQSYYRVANFNTKINLISKLLAEDATMTKIVIFTATKAFADLIYNRISGQFGEKMAVIHSNKSQNHRFNTVNEFQNNQIPFLVATDIIARGIDISKVSHVINFDIPDEPEDYMHRVGRTGRADQKGIAISFVGDREVDSFHAIEALMQMQPTEIPFPEGVEVSNELIMEELPVVKMKNTIARIPVIFPSKSAFQEKKLRVTRAVVSKAKQRKEKGKKRK